MLSTPKAAASNRDGVTLSLRIVTPDYFRVNGHQRTPGTASGGFGHRNYRSRGSGQRIRRTKPLARKKSHWKANSHGTTNGGWCHFRLEDAPAGGYLREQYRKKICRQ